MKILIIKPSSFGDIIQSNPTLLALVSAFPSAEIKWLIFKKWESVLCLFGDLSGKLVWDRKNGIKEYLRVISEVRKGKFDLVIDLQGLARTAVIARLSGARQIIGVPGMKEFGWLLIKEVFPENRKLNAVLRNLETARYLTGKTHDPVFKLYVPEQALGAAGRLLEQNGIGRDDRLVTFIPGARGGAKTWPEGYYDELAEVIYKRYHSKIVALGAEGDAKGLVNPQITDLTGRTSIETLSAILSMSRVVIGGDTGPVHLSAALGVPTVVMFGGSDINETAPLGENIRLISKNANCSPCRGRPICKDFHCLADIKPNEVLKAVAELFRV